MNVHVASGLRSCSSASLRGSLAFKEARSHAVVARAAKVSVIREIQKSLRNKEQSAVEITQGYLNAINASEAHVNSYITVSAQQALEQAKALDEHIAREGTANLPELAGVPLAIKDNLCTKGIRTTAGSQILRDYTPVFDSTSVAKLRNAGAVFIGKANMDEFGMGSSTENSSFKATRNPWDTDRVPGGSSGGSAAAVAAMQCAAALGTDTGGSIRQPAHFCGVVGIKPTYGRVSRYGLVAYASSLDTVGPMARSVEDAALLLNVIAGHDSHDATSSSQAVPDYTSGLRTADQLASSRPLEGRRIGLITQTLGEGVQAGVEAAVRDAAKHLESLGAVVEEVSLPSFGYGLPAYYVLALSEASSNLSRYDGVRYGARAANAPDVSSMFCQSRGAGLGAEVKRRILMGTYALSSGYYDAYYKRAQQVRTIVQQEMAEALTRYDALLTPTAPTPAYKLGERTTDPLAMYKGDLMTVNVNLSGLPALVLPCAYVPAADTSSHKLPVGLQLIGKAFGEADLISLAHVYEQTAVLPDIKPAVVTAA